MKNIGGRGEGATPRCLFSTTHTPPAQGRGGGGQIKVPPAPLWEKRHAIPRVSRCNSVLVCDQMVSEAHKKRDAAVSLHHYKAAHRSNIIIHRGKATTLHCDWVGEPGFQPYWFYLQPYPLFLCFINWNDVPIGSPSITKEGPFKWLLIYRNTYRSTHLCSCGY